MPSEVVINELMIIERPLPIVEEPEKADENVQTEESNKEDMVIYKPQPLYKSSPSSIITAQMAGVNLKATPPGASG